MELQRDVAVERLRCRIGEIDNLDAVEVSDEVVAFYDEKVVVPVSRPDHSLVFGGRPGDPLAAVAIKPARVVIHGRVDLKLHALRNPRRSGIEISMEEYAAVAHVFAFEPQRQMKIFVLLFGPEVAVLFGDALAVDGSVLHFPLLVADLHPAGEVLVVKQGFPAGFIRFRTGGSGGLKSIYNR